MKTFEDFDAAVAECPDGSSVGGTLLHDGTPAYFHHVQGASDDEMRRLAFEVREGRPMSEYEQYLLNAARELRGVPS